MKRKITKTNHIHIVLNSYDYSLLEKYCNLFGMTKTKLIAQMLRALESKK